MITAEARSDARLLRYLGMALLLVGMVWFLYLAREILTLFVLGALIAYVFDPWLDRLEARGWSRARAVAVVYGGGMLLLFVVFVAMLPLLFNQIEALSANADRYSEQLHTITDDWKARIVERAPQLDKALGQAKVKVLEVSPRLAAGVALWLTDQLPKLFTYLVILPLLTFYFMLDFDGLSARGLGTIPADYRATVLDIASRINRMLGRFVRGQLIVCAIYGAASTVWFVGVSLVFGTNYALLLGLLTAVLSVIPFFGILVMAVAAALVGYLTCDPGKSAALAAVLMPAGLLAFNPVIDNVITPRIIGQETGLHPVTVIFALMSASQVAGIPGMIVAIPAAAAVKIILVTLFPRLTAKTPDEPVKETVP